VFSHVAEVTSRTTVTATVVICAYTWDRWDDTKTALTSACNQTTAPDQLILVIDHNDELLQRATTAFPDVTVIANAGPRGLSGARNTGVAASRCDVIAFLDDDAEADTEWLERLVQHYADPDVIGVGGRAMPRWDQAQPSWFPSEFLWVVGCSFTGQPAQVAPVRNMIGCNMSLRRDTLQGAGGFNSALGRVGQVPVGCEETELCIRAQRRHSTAVVLYDPEARVHHRVRAERSRWEYFRRRCFAEGLSKAVVARLVGAGAGLSSERAYTRSTLPRGVWRELRSSVKDPAGLLRAVAIVAGLTITAAGYLSGRATRVTNTNANRVPTPTVPDTSAVR
jgi:GT2 family glycosyltransferase